LGGWTSQLMAGVQSMPRSKNSKTSAIKSLFNRREKALPEEEEVTVSIIDTLEDISRQVKQEATNSRLLEDDFFSPTHVMNPKANAVEAKAEAASSRKENIVRHCRLTPDQYENIIENSLSVLDMASQIIDRNRAITSKLKKAPV
jgi:hypothetical protein